MSQLVNNLLALSKIDETHQPSNLVSMDLVIQTVLQNLELAVSESGAVIKCDPLPMIEADSTFDQQYAEKMFQLFTRLHNSSQFTGTGIGLSICEKVINKHGGAIYAQGEVGKGAVFRVYLPC